MQGVDCGGAKARLNDRKLCHDVPLVEGSMSSAMVPRFRRMGEGEAHEGIRAGTGLGELRPLWLYDS